MFSARIRTARRLSVGIVTALLFSLLIPSLALAKDSWSMYQHDAKHSGQSGYKGPSNPSVLWVIPFGSTGKPTTPIAVSESGKLFVGVNVTPAKESSTTTTSNQESSGHSGVFAFSPDNKVLWVSKINGKVSGPLAIGKGGTVYAAIENNLVALKEKDGSAKWKVPLNSESTSGVVLGQDGTVYVATSEGKTLYAVSSDGNLKWTYTANSQIDNPPAIGSDGTVYFTGRDLYLYAVRADSSLKWKFKVTEQGTDQLSAPALGQDDTVYFGGNRNQGYLTDADDTKEGVSKEYLYAISPDGNLKWRFQASGKTVNTPAVAKDGSIVFSTTTLNYTVDRSFTLGDCFVQAVNPDGTSKWNHDSPDNAIDGPAIIGLDGYVYVSSTEGAMTCISSERGTVVWRAKVGGKACIGPKGIIYVAAKSSIAAIIDKNQKIAEKKGKRIEDITNKNSPGATSLSFLIYILPVIIALGIGYFFKVRVNAKDAEEDK